VRNTRIGLASYAIASVLVVAVVGVAWTRSRALPEPEATPAAERAAEPIADAQESGATDYQSECSGCHGEGQARGRSIPALRGFAVELFTSEGGRAYLIDFMLDGRVRSVEDGEVAYVESHASYGELPDARIAAILDHMLVSWGNDALLPAERRPYTAAEVAARRMVR
jgi:mono/diheme cytochrome c family protein